MKFFLKAKTNMYKMVYLLSLCVINLTSEHLFIEKKELILEKSSLSRDSCQKWFPINIDVYYWLVRFSVWGSHFHQIIYDYLDKHPIVCFMLLLVLY